MVVQKNNLQLMFDRPLEPLFTLKGDKKASFNLPPNFYTERYRTLAVSNRWRNEANETIDVNNITEPDLSEITQLRRDENFTLFLPKHRRIADRLITLYMNAANLDEFQSLLAYTRDRVNPYLFNYATSVALLHRPDTRGVDVPNHMQSFPDKYVESPVLGEAREQVNIVETNSRTPIEIPVDYTASALEDEHRIAYFTEDPGINLHHWHWHLVYPFVGPRNIVDKDRRGELFYYFHHQMIARYNFERLSNSLSRVKKFIDFREVIPQSYYPKLDSIVANRAYPGRPAGLRLQNVNREQDQWRSDIQDMETARSRILDAIQSGSYQDANGNMQPLTEFEGIDVLGNMIEASILSPNMDYYGDLHNLGHLMISVVHDPDHRHLELFGVIGDPATAMRDPMFYRWHSFIDDLFFKFKNSLPRYTVDQLNYPGVTVTSADVQAPNSAKNVFNTFWQQSDVNMSRGLDFQPRGNVFVRFTHLQHQAFNYIIRVNNEGSARQGTCRIFLAPKFDEKGNPWAFRDQKEIMFELDRFVVNLNPGENVITQSSTASSLTIPFERVFRNLELGRPTEEQTLEDFNFCGCGWPQYVLLPKGTEAGMRCDLFVMISNIEGDRIDQDVSGQCNDAAIYCGIRSRRYPDRRSMGYPFDRAPRDGVNTLADFLTPNMRATDVTILHHNRTVRQRPQQQQQ